MFVVNFKKDPYEVPKPCFVGGAWNFLPFSHSPFLSLVPLVTDPGRRPPAFPIIPTDLEQATYWLSTLKVTVKVPAVNLLRLNTLRGMGGAVASWLVRSSPDRAVRFRALAGDIVLCSWARHLSLTMPFSTHYKLAKNNSIKIFTTRTSRCWTSVIKRLYSYEAKKDLIKELGHAILGNFSTHQIVVELRTAPTLLSAHRAKHCLRARWGWHWRIQLRYLRKQNFSTGYCLSV